MPRRKIGDVEKAVLASLTALEVDWRKDGVAAAIVHLARRMDGEAMTPRDETGMAARIEMGLARLREWNKSGEAGDQTGAARQHMEDARKLYAVE
jgi:hypothetical protein